MAVLPRMRKRIGGRKLVAGCEEEQGRAHAVGDMKSASASIIDRIRCRSTKAWSLSSVGTSR